jgi:uncharacterized surface protein with fasciclin (FAS1) repeats
LRKITNRNFKSNHQKMKKITLAVALMAGIFATKYTQAQETMMKNEMTVQVGGAAMYPSKNIVENAMNSKDHTTLVAAVGAAGLAETLQAKGPFTVFAPTNSAFDKLPSGAVQGLLKEENKAALVSTLTYHVVAVRLDSKELLKWIKKGNGTAELTTVQGGKLWIMENADGLWVKDEKGRMAQITIKDVRQSNGIIHVVDTVLMPQ